MKKILPIGTVIKLKNRNAMICGYDYRNVNDKLLMHYILIPHPEGYTKASDIRIIPAAGIEVVGMGYQTDAHNLLERYYGAINLAAEKTPAPELMAALNDAVARKQRGEVE